MKAEPTCRMQRKFLMYIRFAVQFFWNWIRASHAPGRMRAVLAMLCSHVPKSSSLEKGISLTVGI